MSIINRPASSLSQYRPGTGYDGVLPDIDGTTDRPDSRLSFHSRPGSRLSVQSRPCSRLSTQSRPDSRLSTQSRPDSRLSTQSRPDSRLSTQSRPDPRSGSSQSARCRPSSRHARPRSGSSSLLLAARRKPTSGSSVGSEATITRPRSRSFACQSRCDQHRPTSRTSDRSRNRPSSARSIASSTSRPLSSMSRPPLGPKTTYDDGIPATAPEGVPSDDSTNLGRPSSKTTAEAGQTGSFCEQTPSKTENHYDESLCCSCNIRKLRFEQMENQKANLSFMDDKNNFMKGDNFLNKLTNCVEIADKRKNRIQAISNHNFVTANELFNIANKEKIKKRSEINDENCVLIKRPTSIRNNSEKKRKLKQSLLDQIEYNKIKTKTDKTVSLKNEKLMQEELLKNLHEERMKNIEAKARSRENYLNILNEHMKMKMKITEEMKKKNDIMVPNTILGANEVLAENCAKLNKHKNRELANYQLKQHSARNLASREQKNKNIDYERNLLNQFKEEEEKFRKEMLQKKLTQKKYLTEDFNKWLTMHETEHRKNEIPRAYPMTFPLKKMAKRCRLCRKNGLRFPIDKISELPC